MFIKIIKCLKLFRLLTSLLLILLIALRKADEEDSNLSIFDLSNKKSENFIEEIVLNIKLFLRIHHFRYIPAPPRIRIYQQRLYSMHVM